MIKLAKSEIDKQFKKAISLMLMTTVGVASIASVSAFGKKVNINVDNKTISTTTINGDTNKILDHAGVKVSKNDTVNRHEENDGTIKLDVKRAFGVTIAKNGKIVKIEKACGKVIDAINEFGIKLEENDEINFPLDAELIPNMEIVMSKRVKIKITADGNTKETLVPNGSVIETLWYLDIPLSSEDIINVDVTSNIYEGIEIVINRIICREITKTEEIPFKSIVKKTDLLGTGVKKVTTQGKNGKKETTVKETLKDGNVIKSEEISSKIISEPINEMVLEGTNTSHHSESSQKKSSSESAKNQNVLVGSATAYTAPKKARTSTGIYPKEGVTVAINPKNIPYGTKVTIEAEDGSFKMERIAQDTGGALRSGSAVVDIFYESEKDCTAFGRKKVRVYF